MSASISTRFPAPISLTPVPDSLAGGNSLKTLALRLQPETGLADFSPPTPSAQGFASLSPMLESLRIPAEKLAASIQDNGKPLWQKLIEEQEKISESRRKARERNTAINEQQIAQKSTNNSSRFMLEGKAGNSFTSGFYPEKATSLNPLAEKREDFAIGQQRLERLFFTPQQSERSGNTINSFA